MSVEYLVTGGGGFIGSNLVRQLLAEGKSVRVIDNFSTGRKENLEGVESDIEVLEGDIRDLELLDKAVSGVRFILHVAALPSVIRSVNDPLSTHDVNITGSLHLLVKARDAGVERVVLSSSSSVYGDTPVLPKQEEMRPMPLSPYAISKLCDEHYFRVFYQLYGLKTYSLRYFNVFGPRQDPKSQYAAVIPLFISAYQRGEPPTIYGDGGQTRDFTYVDNVVNANIACCTAPDAAAGGVFNVACGDRTSVNELASMIAKLMGTDVKPSYEPARPGDVRDSQADNKQARALLGWSPSIGFEDGLRKTIDWFVS